MVSYVDTIKYEKKKLVKNFNHEISCLYIQDYWVMYHHERFKKFEVGINSHRILRCLLNNPSRLSLTNAEGLQANTCNAVSSSLFSVVAKLGLALSIFKATSALFFP